MLDAIVVGASFAGLAVSNQLRGHQVLIIDRKPVGRGQTSACGTIQPILRHWDLLDTVLQTHHSLYLHVAGHSLKFPSPYPWCTFDYRRLCETLFERSGAEFKQATALKLDGDALITSAGVFRARCLVDASGWRAVLASSLTPEKVCQRGMNFGLETIVPRTKDIPLDRSGLHFWYQPAGLARGVGWAFPRGGRMGVGVASYRGAGPLRQTLDNFFRQVVIQPDGLHGTYFPCTLRPATVGDVFVVGDAAGMCLGLTGEGIRPALFFGEACGRCVDRVLKGELTLAQGLADYADFVARKRIFFQTFTLAQRVIASLPASGVEAIARVIQREGVRAWIFNRYWDLTRAWGTAVTE